MKLANLSLAVLCVAGLSTCSFGADTLADAFKEGKVSGELKAFYWDRDRNPAIPSDSIFNTGVTLNYVTGSLYPSLRTPILHFILNSIIPPIMASK